MKLGSQKDFFAGLMFTVVGAVFAVGATELELGTAADMGLGYFPLMMGMLLVILGIAITLKSFKSRLPGGDRIGAFAWRPMVCVLAASMAFGILLVGLPSIGLPSMGLIAGIYALVIIASMAVEKFRLKESLILATLLAASSSLVFVYALNLRLQVWPAFLVD